MVEKDVDGLFGRVEGGVLAVEAEGAGFSCLSEYDEAMSQPVSLIRSADLADTAEYAYAATAPVGARLIFLAGACPLNLDGTTAGVGDYAAQAAKAIENLLIALRAAGAELDNVLSTRILVVSSSQSDLVEAWNVIREAFGDHDAPSTLMGVTALGYTDQLVEIEAVAAVIDQQQ